MWTKPNARKKNHMQDGVPGSNVSLAKWGNKFLRRKVCRTGTQFCFPVDMCRLVTHMEVCLLEKSLL